MALSRRNNSDYLGLKTIFNHGGSGNAREDQALRDANLLASRVGAELNRRKKKYNRGWSVTGVTETWHDLT